MTALGVALLIALLSAGCEQRDRDTASANVPPAEVQTPATPVEREVNVFFLREAVCEVHAVARVVTGTGPLDFVRAALTELLAGPTEDELAQGYRTRIPDRDQVWRYRQSRLAFSQPAPYEGEEVGILEVRELEGRLLYVNFSPELVAYGRGDDRVCEVIRQIRTTVQQFGEYADVSIAVDGRQRGVLQP